MEDILSQIEAALGFGMYYTAILLSLTVTDICAALESSNGATSGERFKDWYNANLGPMYPLITAIDFWSLRCGVVHQGRFGHPKMQYGRVLFTLPNQKNLVFHNNILNDALNLDATIFCNDIIKSVRRWYSKAKDTENVKANIGNLMRFRPNGLPYYMVGLPIIA